MDLAENIVRLSLVENVTRLGFAGNTARRGFAGNMAHLGIAENTARMSFVKNMAQLCLHENLEYVMKINYCEVLSPSSDPIRCLLSVECYKVNAENREIVLWLRIEQTVENLTFISCVIVSHSDFSKFV